MFKGKADYGTCLHATDNVLPLFGLHSRDFISFWDSLTKTYDSLLSVQVEGSLRELIQIKMVKDTLPHICSVIEPNL